MKQEVKVPLTEEQFDALSTEEKRIEIAVDIIALLDAQIYKARREKFIDTIIFKDGGNRFDHMHSRLDIKSSFPQVEECKVCAVGACLLSITRIKNKLTYKDLADGGIYEDIARNMIASIFEPVQLALIEIAFEMRWDESFANYGRRQLEAEVSSIGAHSAIKFGEEYTDSNDRLKAIMQNLIDNNGTFIP